MFLLEIEKIYLAKYIPNGIEKYKSKKIVDIELINLYLEYSNIKELITFDKGIQKVMTKFD